MENRKIVIIGGGTFSHVRAHLALAAPAFGTTAKQIFDLCVNDSRFSDSMDIECYLTQMAGGSKTVFKASEDSTSFFNNELITNDDIKSLVEKINQDLSVKIVFFNAALVDFDGQIGNTQSGKYADRLKTVDGQDIIDLTPSEKLVGLIRKNRKDITLVAFKTTTGASEDEQYLAGLSLMKKNSINLVLANDVVTRINMIITPEEARYHVTINRKDALINLIDMVWYRSHLTFTKSTVVSGKPIPWNSSQVYSSLRTVVNHCIKSSAYKPFNGSTVGHFACKISDNEFLTSIRKSNFNDLETNGLVRIKTDGPDTVIAYGAKPSVGGQSQRIIFNEHKDFDCIVHFHCPIKENSLVPIKSQREYECGSHQCGASTSEGLKYFYEDSLEKNETNTFAAVMLDNHGPNIVFHHSIDPQLIIDFIEQNFELSDKTGGNVIRSVFDSEGHEIKTGMKLQVHTASEPVDVYMKGGELWFNLYDIENKVSDYFKNELTIVEYA